MSAADTTSFAHLVQTLALKGTRGELLWGVYRGFPLGLTLGDSSSQSDVLIHLRYATHEFAEGEQPELVFADPLPRLMDEGLAEVEIRDDLVWLTLKRLADRLERGEIVPALDSVIGCLEKLGIQPVATCHYCGGAEGVATLASKGRVGQICTTCVEGQIGQDVTQLGFRVRSLAPLSMLAPIVIGVQALLWAGIWSGVDWAIHKLGGSVYLNSLLAGLIVFTLAGLAACPAFLFRFVSNRGNRRAGLLGGLCALIALPLGEILHIMFLFGSVWVVGPLVTEPSLLLSILIPGDGLFGILKLMTMLGFVWFAGRWAKPREIALEL